jgi:hypothetical protein
MASHAPTKRHSSIWYQEVIGSRLYQSLKDDLATIATGSINQHPKYRFDESIHPGPASKDTLLRFL